MTEKNTKRSILCIRHSVEIMAIREEANKDKLKDFLMFRSLKDDKLISLKEYVEKMAENQEKIYYASGESKCKDSGNAADGKCFGQRV